VDTFIWKVHEIDFLIILVTLLASLQSIDSEQEERVSVAVWPA
jgi:hypothetical protein